jgi:UDP-N-acetylmuramoyl-L-alanyl-D-glutamate--2,6-diaminopimelate ligase
MLDSVTRPPDVTPGARPSRLAHGIGVTSTPVRTSDTRWSLDALLSSAGTNAPVIGDPRAVVTRLAYRSGDVRPGALFFCIPGSRQDGHTFAPEAVGRGATVLVAERTVDAPAAAQVVVRSVREAMGPVSAAFFGRPSERMTIVGVTGTNGKTTTTYLLESVFRAAGLPPGVIGTTGVRIAGQPTPFDRTTPEAPDLQGLLTRMDEAGVRAVAMEVSSHGLDQHRVDGTRFACAVFTNLSQDHLDYHPTMEAYFAAKARLFTPELSRTAALNVDSPEGRVLAQRLAGRSDVPVLTFGSGADAGLRATDVQLTAAGLAFAVDGLRITSPLVGAFNVSNCLAALAAARLVGIDDDPIVEGLASLAGVPGRVEPVDAGQPFSVLVDYAHSPDSLDIVLRTVRELTERRVIAVFGCGGDRDRGKRPLMGEAVTRRADLAVITSDNPRSEDPDAIIAEIVPGARRGGGAFVVEPDRRAAIRLAVREARPGDVVVVAGKGHEQGQEFADVTLPFSDRDVAREELESLLEERA